MQPNEWRNKTVGMSTDGASVMTGIRNGVVTKIKADVPHLISVHCIAHRLELGIKDCIKQVAYMFLAKLEDYLLSIYEFYSNIPLNWHNLKGTGTALNIKVLIPANVLREHSGYPITRKQRKQSSRIGLVLTADQLAQLVEYRTAVREVAGSNLDRTNTQGL